VTVDDILGWQSKYKWTNRDGNYFVSTRLVTNSDGNLEIKTAEMSDSGPYKCEMSNPKQTAWDVINVVGIATKHYPIMYYFCFCISTLFTLNFTMIQNSC